MRLHFAFIPTKLHCCLKLFSVAAVGWLSLAGVCYAEPQQCRPTDPNSAINLFMQKQVDDQNIVGGVVAYYHNGRTEFFSFGRLSKTDPRKPNLLTTYRIASITKVFTATLLATSVAHDTVNLTTPVDNYLPRIAVLQPSVVGKINFQELATHTASFPHKKPKNINSEATFFTEFLNNWAPEEYAIGTHYEYSNLGFEFLAYLLTKINNESYQLLLSEHITKPLFMNDTASIVDKDFRYPLAVGYKRDGTVITDDKTSWNNIGYLTSNAEDLMQFIKANLHVTPIPEELSKAFTLTQKSYFQVTPAQYQGLGWQISKITTPNGVITVYDKNGAIPGYSGYIGFNRDTKSGIVILTNYQKSDFDITNKISHVGNCILQY